MNSNPPIMNRFNFKSGPAIVFYIAIAKLLLHLFVNTFTAYGFFRDELYYIACSDHLALGYPDQPPLSLFLLALSRVLFGDSLVAIRILPALFGSGTVFITGLIARDLGGMRFAQILAALGSCCSLILMGMTNFWSMNIVDIFLWSIASYIVLAIIRTEKKHFWIALGIIVGLGALNKISMLWFGAGVGIGLILTPHRKWLKTPWPWICGAIALLLFTPYVIWNVQNNFAHLEFMRQAASHKYASQNPLTFISGQFLLHGPLSAPLWLAGIFYFFFLKSAKQNMFLGYLFLVPFVLLIINWNSKAEYLAAAYCVLYAGGGVMLEQWLKRDSLSFLKWVYPAIVIISFLLLLPMAVPILPVKTFVRYSQLIGVEPPSAEGKELSKLPQFYADMFGWEDKAAAVGKVWNTLSDEDKEKGAIYASNYGRCGAIDFFGKEHDLPGCIGSHNSYWIWGPGDDSVNVLVVLGGDIEDCKRYFSSVEIADTVSSDYAMPYENDLNIYICRNPKKTLREIWSDLKVFI